jgi:hypothetical protein
MSVDKYSKHQRSKLPRYVNTLNGEVLFSANTLEDFMAQRKAYNIQKAIEKVTPDE